jgi:hypothetical protein
MSIFASESQTTIAIPFDPPHTVTIRKLSRREWMTLSQIADGDAMNRQAMQWCVLGWSYATPVTPEALDDLDVEAYAFISNEIVYHTMPSLRPAAPPPEVAQKNG